MNSRERFEQVYSKIVQDNEQELENLRRNARKENNKRQTLIIVSIVIGIIAFGVIKNYWNDDTIYIVFPFTVIIYLSMSKKIKKGSTLEYNHIFKERVIKQLLKSFNENLEYFPNDKIDTIKNEITSDSATEEFINAVEIKDENLYNDIGIDVKTFFNRRKDLVGYSDAEFEKGDTFTNEDLIKGVLRNNCYFEMAEVLTEYETTDSDGDEQYHTLFSGMFARIRTPKPFNARLYIRKNIKEKNVFAKLSRRKLPFDNLRLEMDSQEFEKIFDVYCDNKIVAMQLLTADVMQMLINFYNEMGMEYEITIKNNVIYIRFWSGKMFETGKVSQYSLDKSNIYRYYKMLDFTFSLTNKLVNMINDTEY